MDSDGLPIVGSGVDYSKVNPLHQKRTLTFLNHFLIRTTSFLNHFSSVCDEKLENLLIRIQRLEASMCILEAKLASIPGLDDVSDAEPSETVSSPHQNEGNIPEPSTVQSMPDADQTAPPPPSAEPQKPLKTVSQDPRYAKYFKMINMGVPVGAVQLKMTAEGVDPELLNNPDAEAPPGAPEPSSDDESRPSDESDFSD